MDNIGIDGKLERSKSTPDLLNNDAKARKNIIYATPTVPDKKSNDQRNVYAVPGVNTSSSASVLVNVPSSPNGIQLRPSGPPPLPPQELNSPKKMAPKPPRSDSGESSASEVITINTVKQSPYATSTKVLTKQVDSIDSSYESSFRPGASAKLSEEPTEESGYKLREHRMSSAGTGLVKEEAKELDKQIVTFAEDKVFDHAAGFLKNHPNAKLLMTAEGQDKGRKRSSNVYEPEPDYDSDSGEEKLRSPVRKRDPNRQSVTVISVGGKKEMSQTQTKRYTIHSSIPSEDKQAFNYSAQSQGFLIPPRPDGPAPTPPAPSSQSPRQFKSAAPVPPSQSSRFMTVTAEVNPSTMGQYEPEDSDAPPLPDTPPPDFDEPLLRKTPAVAPSPPALAPPPPAVAPPPPPPPPPPAPSMEQISKRKSVVKADYIAPVTVSNDAIAAAVAKRQERLQNDGLRMFEQKPKSPAPVTAVESNQAAILAAVAKRREKLELQSDTHVIDSIESRLQKTKKLQAAKFQITSAKGTKKGPDAKPEMKSNGTPQNKPNISVQSSVINPIKKKVPIKVTEQTMKEETTVKPTELSFKVKPVNLSKYQTGMMEIKPKFAPKPLSSTNTKHTNSKIKTQESLKLKPKPLEKSVQSSRDEKHTDKPTKTNNKVVNSSEQVNNDKNVNGQSDFLALAEKRRQEWLQRKQKSSESKSSTPEKEKFQTKTIEINSVDKKDTSPLVSAKPKVTKGADQSHIEFQSPRGLVTVKPVSNINGDINKNGTTAKYTAVPPPPPGFRDGGNTVDTVVQLEIVPPPANFISDIGTDMSHQHSPAFSPDTASLVSSLSTLSSLSGDGQGNGYEDIIAPPPPGFDDGDTTVIPPPPEFGNDNNGNVRKSSKTFHDKPVDMWLCNDVLDWLDSLNMSQYKISFQRNCIDGKKLAALSRNNYIDLGVTQVGHRMNLERSIKKAAISQNSVANNVIASEHL